MNRTTLLFMALAASARIALCTPPRWQMLEVRLKTHLTSYTSKAGQPFECVVIRPYEVNGHVVIPQGTAINGHVLKVSGIGLGFVHDRAKLELSFDDYTTPFGQKFPLSARLISIDNSREQVNPQGRIKGVLAAGQPNQLIFGLWERPSVQLISHTLIGLTGASNQIWARFSMGPIGAGALLALRCVVIRFPEPEIHLPPGTDMKLAVSLPADRIASAPAANPPSPEAPEELEAWIQSEPYSVEKPSGRVAGDIINVAFLGTQEELVNAFQAAGWAVADPNTRRNLSQIYYAFNTMRDYPTAPVSTLLYKGTEPDFVFEKSLDTISKRHHIRVWRAGILDGSDVWLGAATHDTGIKFDMHAVNFTHKIDSNVDAERTKVATDLAFAGCTLPETRVQRPAASSNGDEGGIVTDGEVAVLPLQPCAKTDDMDASLTPDQPGNKMSRLTRRIVLEARNHLLRENAYYWTYQLIRHRRAERAAAESGI